MNLIFLAKEKKERKIERKKEKLKTEWPFIKPIISGKMGHKKVS